MAKGEVGAVMAGGGGAKREVGGAKGRGGGGVRNEGGGAKGGEESRGLVSPRSATREVEPTITKELRKRDRGMAGPLAS